MKKSNECSVLMLNLLSSKEIKNCKMVFFLGCINPYPGGGWIRISSLAEDVKKKNFQVQIIGTFSINNFNKAGRVMKNNLTIFNVVPTFTFFPILDIPFSIITLTILFLVLRPKIVLISVPGHKLLTPIGAYIGARISRAKIIFDYRDEWEDMAIREAKRFRFILNLLKTLMTSLYANSDIVLINSPKFINNLKNRGIRKIETIFTGTDTEIMKPYNKQLIRKELGLPYDAFIVIYSGLIGGCYKLDIVVKALSIVKKNVILILIGTGPDLYRIFKLKNKFHVKIVYVGTKNDMIEIAKILSSADVGVIPYDDNPLWKNTVPTKFFEYCACGLPIIANAYDDSIIARLVISNKIGLICKPLDIKELAETIERLRKDIKFRQDASKRARMFVEQNYDRKRIAEKFLYVIENLLGDLV